MPGQTTRKLLFVCSRNRSRSLTAERIFKRSDCYEVRSRGTASNARIKLTEQDIGWADIIFCMEKTHTDIIRERFRPKLADKTIITLFIKDLYPPMDATLQQVLREKLSPHILLPEAPALANMPSN
jgi:predicted protein tyrosine phosphatase